MPSWLSQWLSQCLASWLALWLATVLPMLGSPASGQGFAELGAPAESFALPSRKTVLTFPGDHGPHPEFRIEWWYLTANLEGPDGVDYGLQWTLFRTALAPGEAEGWQSPQLWMGHAAVTTPTDHHVAERLARGGVGQAGVSLAGMSKVGAVTAGASPFRAWIDDWQMLSTAAPGDDALSALELSAKGADFGYAVSLKAEGPIVLQGDRGYSVKSEGGQASHYYSQPFYRLVGRLDLPGGPVEVTGQAWLDREWSSQPLAADQTGWDWFSLSFDSGDKLMGFVLRDAGGGFTSGTWIGADGVASPLEPGALRARPLDWQDVAGRSVPVGWQLTLPERGLDVTLTATNRTAWMATSVPYWEGPVRITGSHTGRGYLEMTGY